MHAACGCLGRTTATAPCSIERSPQRPDPPTETASERHTLEHAHSSPQSIDPGRRSIDCRPHCVKGRSTSIELGPECAVVRVCPPHAFLKSYASSSFEGGIFALFPLFTYPLALLPPTNNFTGRCRQPAARPWRRAGRCSCGEPPPRCRRPPPPRYHRRLRAPPRRLDRSGHRGKRHRRKWHCYGGWPRPPRRRPRRRATSGPRPKRRSRTCSGRQTRSWRRWTWRTRRRAAT